MAYTYKLEQHPSHGILVKVLNSKKRVVKVAHHANEELGHTAGRYHTASLNASEKIIYPKTGSWKNQSKRTNNQLFS